MGGKSQGSARTPHEAPDSLKSAQRLRAIGLISLGPIKGPVNKWKSTYFDNTPIQNENGIDDNDEASFNFKNTEVSFTLGTQDQAPLQGFEMSEREVSVSTEVKYTTPITRTVTDPDVTRLRVTLGVNALYEQNDQGDTNGTSVWFRILINGLPRATYEINGKSSSRFYRSYIVDNLPERPFTITVERMTADSKSQRLQNATNWVSYTEIIDTKLSYPNMALVGIKTDSRYNPNFPNVNFLLYGRLVKVPSTYDPETRTYSTALWKGEWKQAWTNNPAWVFYDLVTDPLAGLGKRVGDYGLDKFQLYQIAKYCDELVDDGYGGKEPRMTANLWLTDQRSAYDVLSDMASVFRAIAVWNGTQFTAIQDRTTDPVCTYSQANVIDGKFSRQYAAMKSIYTAAEVEYADERNMYQKAVEYVADDAMIARYGYNVKKMTAYATTSRGQAHRWGKWVLATSLLEQCTITFSVGRQGLLHLPGDIIEVADNDYAGKTLGGRVVAVNGKVVTLDQPIEISGNSYLSYLNDEMKVVKAAISSVDSKNKAVVTLATVPTGLEPMDDWVLKNPTVSTQLYRAIGITENDDGSYTITALQHEPQKEAIVDNGATFEPRPSTLHNAPSIETLDLAPSAMGVKAHWYTTSGSGTLTYDIRVLKNGQLYAYHRGLTSAEFNLDDLPDGEYTFIVRAKNASGQMVSEKSQTFTINRPPAPTNVIANGGLSEVMLAWDYVDDVTQTEIWVAEVDDLHQAKRLAKVLASFYSHAVGARQTRYYWVRHVRGRNAGAFFQQMGLRAETGADIAAELAVLNEQLKKPIINEVIDVALPARKLGMTLYVDRLNLNTYQGQKQVFDETTNKLYAWNGTKYQPLETELLAGAIKGIIQPNQLANIPTTKLSGLLTDTQIQSVSAGKINGVIDLSKVPAIPTTKLTGMVSANQIAANAIGANHLASNAITAGKIAANSIQATHLQANSVGVNALQAGAVNADKIATNAITSAKIMAGAINANHLQAGQISTDKLAVGLGGNLLYNPIFANLNNGLPDGCFTWHNGVTNLNTRSNHSVDTWSLQSYLPNENMLVVSADGNAGSAFTVAMTATPAIVGQWYILSAYMGAHRGECALTARCVFKNGSYKDFTTAYTEPSFTGGIGKGAERKFIKFQAPENTVTIQTIFWLRGTNSDRNKILMVARPMLEECTQYATAPSAWVNAGVTAIHGGSIVTNTVTADKIGANQITANHITAGAISAGKIAANAVNASHIASRAITADKLSVQTLSAVSSNLGTVTAGTIRGTTINGSTITGTTVNGGTISGTTVSGGTINGTNIRGSIITGGTIRGAHFEGATGTFTGTLTVGQLLGSNILEVVTLNNVSYRQERRGGSNQTAYNYYSRTITIKPAPVERLFLILNSNVSQIIPANQSKVIHYSNSAFAEGGGTGRPPEIRHDSTGISMTVMLIALTSAKTVS